MANKHLISPKLRKLRRERDLSLDEVAIKTGIDRSALSRKERRLLPVSEAELMKLAAFFGVDSNELMGEEGALETQAALVAQQAVAGSV